MAPGKQNKTKQFHSIERNGINKQLNKMIKAQSEQAVAAELSGALGQKRGIKLDVWNDKFSLSNTPNG